MQVLVLPGQLTFFTGGVIQESSMMEGSLSLVVHRCNRSCKN
jgi:hypothetical protein